MDKAEVLFAGTDLLTGDGLYLVRNKKHEERVRVAKECNPQQASAIIDSVIASLPK